MCSAKGVTTSQHQPGSLPLPSPQGNGEWDELLAARVLSGSADVCPWLETGSKNMLKASLAHVSNVASAEVQLPKDVWLLSAPLSCLSVVWMAWNKQFQDVCSDWYKTGQYCVLPVH